MVCWSAGGRGRTAAPSLPPSILLPRPIPVWCSRTRSLHFRACFGGGHLPQSLRLSPFESKMGIIHICHPQWVGEMGIQGAAKRTEFTSIVFRKSHMKLGSSKAEPGSSKELSCSLISLHFAWDILSSQLLVSRERVNKSEHFADVLCGCSRTDRPRPPRLTTGGEEERGDYLVMDLLMHLAAAVRLSLASA